MGKKFDINAARGAGPVNQLLNPASLALSGQGKKIMFLPLELLAPLPTNDDVYQGTPGDLDATAKDIAEIGIRQPLIVFKDSDERYSVISGNRRLAATKLAIEKYGASCETIPCIIQQAPKTSEELRKRMIKDNLQRSKTGYERMREIIVYRQAVEEEWRKEGIISHPTVRDVLCADLGATNSEITRYLKINDSLIPELMEKFKEQSSEGGTMISTSVAHRLSKEPEERQKFIFQSHQWTQPLTNAAVTNLLVTCATIKEAERTHEEPPQESTEPAPTRKTTDYVAAYQLSSIHDGTSRLAQACSSLTSAVSTSGNLNEKIKQRLLKKIAAELVKIEALTAELQSYQGASDADKS